MVRTTLWMAVIAMVAAVGASEVKAAGHLRGAVSIDGSSTVYPITEAVAEEFRNVQPNVRVTVGISGTGGGFKRFSANETDISDASRPIKAKELAACKEHGVEFVEVPVAYDGLSIVVNKANDWVVDLSVADLKKIFLAGHAAKSWKDVNPKYPDIPIKIYAPGTDSGTFDYFKEVVAGKTGSIRGDMSVSEDDNVLVRGVAGEKGAIGFFGCAYYFENMDKIRAVPIEGVMPTSHTIEKGIYSPFSRPLFIYVKTSAYRRPEVKAFVDFYMEKGPELAEEVGYVKLPKLIYERGAANLKARKAGTQFLTAEGEKIHGALPAVYK